MSVSNYVSEVNGVFGRWTRKTLRRPQFLFFSLVQPIVWFVLFTQAFSSIANIPGFAQVTGTDSYLTFFTAAVIIQTAVIIALGFAMGVTIAMGIPGLLMLFVIAMAFGIAWSGISTFIGLATKNSESTLMISLLTTFPLLFLSTAVMPKFLLPSWVQTVATYNPMTYIANLLHALVITGFDWTTFAYAALTILVVGALSLSATTSMFRRTVSG